MYIKSRLTKYEEDTIILLEQFPRSNILPVCIYFQKFAGTAFEDELDLLFQAWLTSTLRKIGFE